MRDREPLYVVKGAIGRTGSVVAKRLLAQKKRIRHWP